MTDIVLVQASRVLPDADVIAALPSITRWAKLVTDAYALEPVAFSFMHLDDFFASKASGAWPLFLNRHSLDPGALGYHTVTDDGVPYGRSCSGDDILDGISPWVTLTHEAGEMLGNPFVKSFVTLRDGSVVPREFCDATESDNQAIVIDNLSFSNFVLPTYWEDAVAHPPGTKYDHQGTLSGPCPSLTRGGYQSILRPGATEWSQITDMRIGGRPSVRSLRNHTSVRNMKMHAALSPRSTP